MGAPPSPGIRGLYARRLTVLLPVNAAAHRTAWWRRRLWLLLVATLPVVILFVGHELLGWRKGALSAAGAGLLVVGFWACWVLIRRDFQVTYESEGWATLRVPNPVAAEAIAAALAEKGLSAPRTCLQCKAAGTPPFGGSGHGRFWTCETCAHKPGVRRKKRPLWLAVPIAFLILVFVVPFLLTWSVVRRMGKSIAAFAAGCAVLGGIAALFVSSGAGVRGLAGPVVACSLTGGAWVLAARPGDGAAKKAVAFAIFLDLVALLHVVARILVES